MKNRNGFSLIEMIVVIAIIGILAGIMLTTMTGGSDSARAARCLTNMRNLAAACQSYGMVTGYYTPAGSIELYDVDVSNGKRNLKEKFSEFNGWVSWNSQGIYSTKPTSSKASSGWITSCYDQNIASRTYALTNGALWKYVSGNHEVYLCPNHVHSDNRRISKLRLGPNWSYFMNAYFGWTARPGSDYYTKEDMPTHWYRGFQRSDRFLLFAEIPFEEFKEFNNTVSVNVESSGMSCDGVLQYKGLADCSQNESIGFNHRNGKNIYANVVFADGHTEKLVYPKNGMSLADMQELTQWLCEGRDITFTGTKYEKMTSD